MNILAIGDVVSAVGCEFLRSKLPAYKKLKAVDICIANGENSAVGNGITPTSAQYLFDSGVGVITTGNHVFRRREVYDMLDESDRIIRPANFHKSSPGKGFTTVDMGFAKVSTNPCLITPEYLEAWAAMGVKFLPCRSIGYDHIPQQKAKELGMRISHSWYPPAGVADYAIMLMLMCNRKVGQILRRADAQDYSLNGKMGRDITRMTVGVIGTGNIGRTVLRHLSGFGCKLLAYDLYPNDEARQYAEYVDLDTLYKSCDIITLHTNATAANRHMIDANAIAKMKNGVVLINTARGTLIDPEALINGLESGKIGAAGLDVVENENGLFYFNHMGDALQNRELAMLRSFPNVIFTPHTAFYTDVNVASMVESAFKAVRAMADGEQTPLEVRL